MKEYIGKCQNCHKSIYCLDGFLNGVSTDQGLLCFNCERQSKRS